MTQSSSSDVDTTISVYLRSKLKPDALNKWFIFQKKNALETSAKMFLAVPIPQVADK